MLKLVVADKQPVFRAGIAKVLAVEDEMRIVAQAQTPEQIPMALERFRPNVVVCSVNFYPDTHSLSQAVAKVKGRLVLIAESGENTNALLTAGAHGVVYRNVTGPALLDCVRTVARGENYVQDNAVPAEVSENDMVGARVVDRLTNKELRIVALIVQGYKNKEIATELGTTEQVIKNYLRNVYDKIGVSDRLELALFTIHHRILAEAAAASAAGMTPPAQDATKTANVS
jgi:DNA-binding NarL/FixJ family response regulator